MSLTLRNVRLAAAPHETLDIAVVEGSIAAVGRGLGAAERDIDLEGRLVLPGLVETHIHLDKACILDRCSPEPGDLGAAIGEVSRLKEGFTADDVRARAERALRKCVANGTMRMRTHVEVDPRIGLRGFEGVRAALGEFRWALDGEICVFPQEGLLNNPGTEELLVAALEAGAEVLGACPYTDSDPEGQIDRIFALARRFDVDIDMHLDFDLDPTGMTLEHVCRRTEEHGWGGRVAVGHVTKLSALQDAELIRVARRLAQAGVAVTVLPATDLFLMGRAADGNRPRGVTPAHRLLDQAVRCSLSTNNLLNPFTPFGDGSLIRIANLYANVCQVAGETGLRQCLEMISEGSARLMNLTDYGIAVGMPADLLVLDTQDPATAIAELAQPLMGFKRGRRSFTRAAPELHAP
jgi:cytosine deaminase